MIFDEGSNTFNSEISLLTNNDKKVDFHIQKKLDFFFASCIKVNPKWIQDINITAKISVVTQAITRSC